MEFLKFDVQKCILCGKCVDKCPFGALRIENNGIKVGDSCRMCGLCVRHCQEKAIRFEQRADMVDKEKWRDFLIYAEQERGDIHPVAFELIGEARRMAAKVGYKVNCVIVGASGTAENAQKLLAYGVDKVYVYEHPGFEGFRADCYADALGGQLAFTRPMVENGFGDTAHQIGLSGRTVRPRLIITCGVSGAIQFTSCMNGSECIVAINSDPEAQIFKMAHYCIVDDLYQVVPQLTALIRSRDAQGKTYAEMTGEIETDSVRSEKGGE